MDISNGESRLHYSPKTLDESDLDENPIRQFDLWLNEAMKSEPLDAVAMTVSTVSAQGTPSARILLLRGFDERGFVFFTNYESRKARELEATAHAALTFHWPTREQQVRIEGAVAKTSPEESAAYFASRPRGSQIGAWASSQSEVLSARINLEARVAELEKQYENQIIPCPSNWGGYRVTPLVIEFWQGRASRLHDRLRYTKQASAEWTIERLSP